MSENRTSHFLLTLITVLLTIIVGGGGFLGSSMYTRVTSIEENQNNYIQRIVRLESSVSEINKNADKTDLKLDRILKYTRP